LDVSLDFVWDNPGKLKMQGVKIQNLKTNAQGIKLQNNRLQVMELLTL